MDRAALETALRALADHVRKNDPAAEGALEQVRGALNGSRGKEVERIAQALQDLANPTPTEVRTVLNDLGYVDERIHDLKQSGATTRFLLDLRDKGGRLCLEGSAAGENTVVDKCLAPATGPFTPEERKQ